MSAPQGLSALLVARPRAAFAAIALGSLAAVAAALVSQHVFEMQPCPWCVLQRLVFVLIALVATTAALAASPRRRALAVGAGGLVAVLALAGAAAALWQHFVAASSASCDLTLADRIMSGTGLDMALPEVFAAFASCADANVNLFGVPYEYWSLALFALIALAALLAARAPRLGN